MSQAVFDIDAMILAAEREAAPAWQGAPLRYHEEHRTPAELDDAFDRWIFEHGRHGCIPDSHMWHRLQYGHEQVHGIHEHRIALFTADAFCDSRPDHDHSEHPLPGEIRYQGICEPCDWRISRSTSTKPGSGCSAPPSTFALSGSQTTTTPRPRTEPRPPRELATLFR